MSRNISRAEAWERTYEAFQQINFTAFDYNSVKSSLVEYIKIYHPETFNDYIESSEFIALLELFAYISELLAYRIDMNAHENFISTAERKQSILRLATLLSYNPSRNIPARGLVKLDSITTTESVFDSSGANLANTRINWNDPNNADWKEQFFLIVNRVLQQDFGTVSPSDRVQVDDVLFELYTLNNAPLVNGVFTYNVSVGGRSYPMELVPSILNEQGPRERRPGSSDTFSFLYGSDGLGDSSDTTGFFMFTKQGTLSKETNVFDGITPNLTYESNTTEINDTDVWVNQVDPVTNDIIQTQNIDELGRQLGVQGEWELLTRQGVENIIFNTDLNRNKYQIETLEDDRIRLIFGDGEFSDIPNGSFDIWVRQSANENLVIPRNSVEGVSATFSYQDDNNNVQTVTFTYSLISTLTNSSESETIEQIRQNAPLVYTTQNRMVNGPDYNNFPLQDQSIIKLRSINRTFAGDSKYLAWHDPSEFYDNVKIFGNDLVVFYRTDNLSTSVPNQTQSNIVIREFIQPLLTNPQVLTYHAANNIQLPQRAFTNAEVIGIQAAYDTAVANDTFPVSLVYEFNTTISNYNWVPYVNDGSIPSNAVVTFTFEEDNGIWDVTYNATRIIAESPTTRFWFHNDDVAVLNTDSLNSFRDRIVLLKANVNRDRNGILEDDIDLIVVGGETLDTSPNLAQPNINQLQIVPPDVNGDSIPDDLNLDDLINLRSDTTDLTLGLKTLPFSYLIDLEEIEIQALDSNGDILKTLERYVEYEEHDPSDGTNISNTVLSAARGTNSSTIINLISLPVGTTTIRYLDLDYVYFQRVSNVFEFSGSTNANAIAWYNDPNKGMPETENYRRFRGRDQMNFAWLHTTPNGDLIDPSPTNIIDMFVVTRGYYNALKDWVEGRSAQPTPPTPLQLRNDYGYLIDARMISDSVILHPGKFKVIIGQHAEEDLQAKIVVTRSPNVTITDNEIKVRIIETVRSFMEIEFWEFGETFNFTELASQIQANLINQVKSVVLVPTKSTNTFGDLLQITPREDELFIPSITVDDIDVVDQLNPQIIRQCE